MKNVLSLLWVMVLVLTACGDDDGGKKSSAPVLTVSTGDFVWGDSVNISVSVDEEPLPDRVVFYINNTMMGSDAQYPYTFSWDISELSNGSAHVLYARAYSNGTDYIQTESKTVHRTPFPFNPEYIANFDGITTRDANGIYGSETDSRDWQLFTLDSSQNSRFAGVTDVTFYNIEHKVYVNWSTTSELSNAGFRVWRSTLPGTDGFATAIRLNNTDIPGAGTSGNTLGYTYIDSLRIEYDTTYYYWIQSVAENGEIELFGDYSYRVVAGNNSETKFEPVYPNPVTDGSILLYSLSEPATVSVALFDEDFRHFRVLENGVFHQAASEYRLTISRSGLPNGLCRCIYYIETGNCDYWGYGDIQMQ
jgi:hypothetical protein